MKTPHNLNNWQKRYGTGYVMFSTRTGRVLAFGPNLKKMYQTARKKSALGKPDNAVIFLPDAQTSSVFFPINLTI